MKNIEFPSQGEELAEIKKGPKNERNKKVEEFKSELIERKKGLAVLQNKLFEAIHQNPDLSKEDLLNLANEVSQNREVDLPESWQEMIFGVIDEYEKRRGIIKDWRLKYPDDEDLFEAVFKFRPKGEVEIKEGPLALDFRIFDKDDFVKAYHWRSLLNNGKLSDEEMAHKKIIGGALVRNLPDQELSGLIIIENYVSNTQDYRREVFIHEEQHAFNDLIKLGLFVAQLSEINLKGLTSETNEEKINYDVKIGLKGIMDENLGEWLGDHIMDELSAQLKGGRDPNSVYERLTKSKDSGGLYDYIHSYREKIITSVAGISDSRVRKAVLNNVEEVFVVEYRKLIRNAIDAFEELTVGFNYTIEQALALLIQEPIWRWKNFVNRLGKHQNQKAIKEYRTEFDKYGDKLEEMSKKAKS